MVFEKKKHMLIEKFGKNDVENAIKNVQKHNYIYGGSKQEHKSIDNDATAVDWLAKWTKSYDSIAIIADPEILDYKVTTRLGTLIFGKGRTKMSAQNYVLKHLGTNEVCIAESHTYIDKNNDEKGYNFYGKMTKVYLQTLVQKTKCVCLCELIPEDRARLLHFDLDGKDRLHEFIQVLTAFLTKNGYPTPLFAISGSKGKKKGIENYPSYHITITNYYYPDVKSMDSFKERAITWSCYGVDKIYTRNRVFKCVNQCKPGDEKNNRIQKVIRDDNLAHHIVQLLPSETKDLINLDTEEWNEKMMEGLTIEKAKTIIRNYDAALSKKLGERRHTGIYDLEPINDPNPPRINIKYDSAIKIRMMFPATSLVGKYHAYEQVNRFYATQKGSSFEEYNNCIHKQYVDLGLYPPITEEEYNKYRDYPLELWRPPSWRQMKHMLSKIYGVELPIRYLTEMKEQWFDRDKPYRGITPVVVQGKYVLQKHINGAKYQLICVAMGGGKTYLVIEFLKNLIQERGLDNVSFIFPTVKIIQSFGLQGRCDAKGLKVAHYQDFNGKNKHTKLAQQKRLINTFASLHYNFSNRFYYIVLDENESYKNMFKQVNPCHKHNYTSNYKTLVKLIRNAKKVFLMDAYLHKWTIDWLMMLDPETDPLKDFNLIMRCEEEDLIKKNVYIYNKWKALLLTVIKMLKEGKKVFFFYQYASGCGDFPSIIGLLKSLLKAANLKPSQGLAYWGDMHDDDKDDLKDVNKAWKEDSDGNEIMLVITTCCIDVGLNCDIDKEIFINEINEKVHNDCRFDDIVIFTSDMIPARQVIQASMRPRYTKSDRIHLCYQPNLGYLQARKAGEHYRPDPMERPRLVGDEPDHFKFFIECIFTEHRANGLPLLIHFMEKTGYKVFKQKEWAPNDISFEEEEENDYLKTQVDRDDTRDFGFDNAKTIDAQEYQIYDNKKKKTFEEKRSMRKYNIQRHFIKEHKESCGVFWKSKELKILDNLRVLLYHDGIHQRNMYFCNTIYKEERQEQDNRQKMIKQQQYEIAVKFDWDEREFIIQEYQLTEKDNRLLHKMYINNTHDEVYEYFLKRTDNIKRKRVLTEMFGKKCLKPVRETGGKLVFEEEFKSMYLDLVVGGLRQLNEENPFLEGVCKIEEDEGESKTEKHETDNQLSINDCWDNDVYVCYDCGCDFRVPKHHVFNDGTLCDKCKSAVPIKVVELKPKTSLAKKLPMDCVMKIFSYLPPMYKDVKGLDKYGYPTFPIYPCLQNFTELVDYGYKAYNEEFGEYPETFTGSFMKYWVLMMDYYSNNPYISDLEEEEEEEVNEDAVLRNRRKLALLRLGILKKQKTSLSKKLPMVCVQKILSYLPPIKDTKGLDKYGYPTFPVYPYINHFTKAVKDAYENMKANAELSWNIHDASTWGPTDYGWFAHIDNFTRDNFTGQDLMNEMKYFNLLDWQRYGESKITLDSSDEETGPTFVDSDEESDDSI